MARVSNDIMTKRATPVREALRDFVKERLTTADDRTKLAEYMGTSIHYVNSMLYRGEGGLDAWISALLFCLDAKPEDLIGLFQRKAIAKIERAPNEAEKIWQSLDKLLRPREKLWWARILNAAVLESRKSDGQK